MKSQIVRCSLHIMVMLALVILYGCKQEKPRELGVFAKTQVSGGFDLEDIQSNGELIILTLYGAQSYFEYYGEGFGVQYRLADEYAKSIGCTIRVDVMRNEQELKQRLLDGDGDIVAYGIAAEDSVKDDFILCGQRELTHFIDSTRQIAWLVRKDAPLLAESVDRWMAANQSDFKSITTIRVSDGNGHVYTPRRRVFSPMRNIAQGEISQYDNLFRKYSTMCNWDWKLLAAQAYQESGFDSEAVSYMGALGLMQLMPRTAQSMGVSISQAFDPETNLRGAVRLINKLNQHYASIANPTERIKFILAAYNAGPGHIDDARTIARNMGKNPDVWNGNVDQCVLRLSQSQFFNRPDVKCGYMRGTETYEYVANIMARWEDYRSKTK